MLMPKRKRMKIQDKSFRGEKPAQGPTLLVLRPALFDSNQAYCAERRFKDDRELLGLHCLNGLSRSHGMAASLAAFAAKTAGEAASQRARLLYFCQRRAKLPLGEIEGSCSVAQLVRQA